MYQLPYFTENDPEQIRAFLERYPFATIIGSEQDRIAATQVPMLVDQGAKDLVLKGHIMRHTDHFKTILANPEVLVLFTGPQSYISAGWYAERGHGSTWNYQSVQIRGRVQWTDDAGTVRILDDLTNRFEAGRKRPELLTGMSDKYLQDNVQAIAGFRIKVREWQATFKLSQNRDAASFRNIVQELEASGEGQARAVAAAMRMERPDYFT